jgi:hypothetical protein
VCDVLAFSNSYEVAKDITIVTAATTYTAPDFSFSIILVVNQALFFLEMEYSLLNPNQVCYAGLDVWDNPFDTDRKLEICGMDVCTDQQIVIPIHLRGTVLYFDTSTPTQKELDTLSHFHLTLENEWNPHKVRLTRNVMSASQVVNGDQTDDIGEYLHDRFYQSLVLVNGEVRCMAQVETAIPDTRGFQSSKRHPQLNAEMLSNVWHIGLDTAKKTI